MSSITVPGDASADSQAHDPWPVWEGQPQCAVYERRLLHKALSQAIPQSDLHVGGWLPYLSEKKQWRCGREIGAGPTV